MKDTTPVCAEPDHACPRCGDCQHEHPGADGCRAAAPAVTVHAFPPVGSGLMPCCGRTPFVAPGKDRITSDPALVTCTSELERLRTDVTRLRRTWAALGACLIKQGRHEDLTAEDLKDIPLVHAAFLRGHDATRHEAARQYARAEQLQRERDLAVAHDRQPYPTAWAYEQACKALAKHRQRADAAERHLADSEAARVRAEDLAEKAAQERSEAGALSHRYRDEAERLRRERERTYAAVANARRRANEVGAWGVLQALDTVAPATDQASSTQQDRGGCCDCPHEMEV